MGKFFASQLMALGRNPERPLRRIVLDPQGRTPLTAKIMRNTGSGLTTIVVTKSAPRSRVSRLAKKAVVIQAPERNGRIDLRWLLKKLGAENITSLLVEGGGETPCLVPGGAPRAAAGFFLRPKNHWRARRA